MQTFRVRVPGQACRANRFAAACPASSRNMSIFPRFVQGEFAQVARLLDDMSQFQQVARQSYNNAFVPTFRSFQPRFDVREGSDAYELTGELPGCTDINVEFTDASTLTIRGRSSHSREEGTRPASLEQGSQSEQVQVSGTEATSTDAALAAQTIPAADSETSSTYHKASVEDEDGAATATEGSVADFEMIQTPATEAPETQSEKPTQQQQEQQPPQSKYWLSERSVGEFARTFTFPARVDQDTVRAILKDGILSVVVPKAAKATRKITVE